MTERSYATELIPYSTKTWEAPGCQTKTYSHFSLHQRQTKGKVLLQKLNTGHAGENNNNNHIGENNNNIGENNNNNNNHIGGNNNNNIVSFLAQYSCWIINLYFKVIQVCFFFVFCFFVREIIC